jgi:hypothetical protein
MGKVSKHVSSAQRKAMLLTLGAMLFVAWWGLYGEGDRTPDSGADPVKVSSAERSPVALQHEDTIRRLAELETEVSSVPATTHRSLHGTLILVEVVNDLGRPIQGASVFLRRYDDYRRLGTTDQAGRIQGDWSDPEFGIVDATHPDYAPTSTHFALGDANGHAASEPSESQALVVRVIMQPAALIEGSVVVAGMPGPPGITVSAHPSESGMRTWFQAVDQFQEDPQHVNTQTDEVGHFVLRVHPKLAYNLIAGGNGLVQSQAKHRVMANGPPTEIELVYGYALALRFVDPSHREIRNGLTNGNTRSPLTASEKDPDAEIGNFTAAAATLAGLPQELTRPGSTVGMGATRLSTLFYSSSTPRVRVGPIWIMASAAGYADFEGEFWATPLDSTVRTDIPLNPIVSEKGRIRVRIRGGLFPGHAADSTFHSDGAHSLKLRNRIVGTLVAHLRDEWKSGVFEIPDVPAGNYEHWFVTSPNPWGIEPLGGSAPVESLTIEPNKWTEVEYELPRSGAIELKVFRPDGAPYYGSIAATLSRAPGPYTIDGEPVQAYIGGMPVVFKSAPYRIGGLVANNYAVWLAGSPESEEHRPTATVTAGSITEVTLELPF